MPLLDVDICDLNIAHTESQGVQQSLNLTQTWLAMCNNKKTVWFSFKQHHSQIKGKPSLQGKKVYSSQQPLQPKAHLSARLLTV